MNRDSESAGAPADQHVLCRQEIARLKLEYGRVLVLENDAAAALNNDLADDLYAAKAENARLRLALDVLVEAGENVIRVDEETAGRLLISGPVDPRLRAALAKAKEATDG